MVLSSYIFIPLYLLGIPSGANAQAHSPQHVLTPHGPVQEDISAPTMVDEAVPAREQFPLVPASSGTLKNLLDALEIMQDEYFQLWQGIWPSANDWTAAVMGTQVSATLSALTSSTEDVMSILSPDTDDEFEDTAFENLINHYFGQTSAFYFGEHATSLRTQANDDMLWVVLGWLENLKFQVLHTDLRYDSNLTSKGAWHGAQFRIPAAHRARIFHGLASGGWDTTLCGGGMIWSPYLTPYKNAITNELYISASIAMYLYYPRDTIDSPFFAGSKGKTTASRDEYAHDPAHLNTAIQAYNWLQDSNMTGPGGLYGDGFHISGWRNSTELGTRKCDELNTMVYTYNQGVILSALRGLWLATASYDYLRDGHDLVNKVINATGWPNKSSRKWAGLGRGGVLEEFCDASGTCSQDSHTFKGIFFHHFTEFCRPLRPQEERFLAQANQTTSHSDWNIVYELHQIQCRSYRPWIEHNADAALATRNEDGKFGSWWGKKYPSTESVVTESSPLPPGAIDYRNRGERGWPAGGLAEALHRLESNDEFDMGKWASSPAAAQSWMEDTESSGKKRKDVNDRGRGRTVETQAGGVAILRALYQWESTPELW